MRLLLISLLLSFVLTNCPTEGDTDLVEMQATVNPEEAGEVNPPQGTYTVGKEITVTTSLADSQWQFSGWTGDTTAQQDSLTFAITQNMQLVANYEIPSDAQPVLIAVAEPDAGGSVEPDSGSFELGTSVDVEAIPNQGWQFIDWSGDTSASSNPITLTMDKDYELTANFAQETEEQVTLATNADPTEGGEVSPASGDYDIGTTINVEALPTEGWQFESWSGDTTISENPIAVTLDSDYSLTANFSEVTQNYQLTTSTNPDEGGSVDPSGSNSYSEGATVEVEAISSQGWQFMEWSGDTTVTDNPLTVKMDKDYELTANYEKKTFTLAANVNNGDGGTVEPNEGTFEYNTTVDVEALSNKGWTFNTWSGDATGSENPLTLVMDQDYSITADFNRKTYSLSTTASPSEGGSIDPSNGIYEFGTSVEINAIAADGWQFTGWSGDTTVTDNPLPVTFDKDYDLTANFIELPKAFSNNITVTDGSNSMTLTLGMDAEATSGFDPVLDRDVPPPPPGNAFYAQFNIPDYNLAEDYRAIQEKETVWEMEFAPEEEQSITLNWDFSNTNHVGSLTLTDDPESPTFELDMKSNSSYEVSDQSVSTLYIISNSNN